MECVNESSPRLDELRREGMREADEVAAMLRLKSLGWRHGWWSGFAV